MLRTPLLTFPRKLRAPTLSPTSAYGFTGSQAYDDYTGANDGVNAGAGLAAHGGFELNGSSDYINLNTFDTSIFTNKITVCAWVKKIGYNAYHTIAGADTSQLFQFQFYDPTKSIVIWLPGTTGGALSATHGITDGGWHHVAFTYDGAYTRLYIDGVEVGNKVSIGNITQLTTGAFVIGSNGGIGRFFRGSIRELQFFNETLTATQLLEIANQGVPDYSLMFSTDDGVKDKSRCQTPMIPSGAITGNGMVFNGSSDYINIDDLDSDSFTDKITVFALIKREATGVWNVITATPSTGFIHFQINSSNYIDAYLYGPNIPISGGSITDTYWHTVAVTYDGATAKLYLDKVEVASVVGSGNLSKIRAYNFSIGRGFAGGRLFNGKMRIVEIYKAGKSAAWIAQRHNQFIPDSTLLLNLVHGDRDLSRYDVDITNTNAIVGNGIDYTNGGTTWSSITFVSYAYSYLTGGTWKRYFYDGSTVYTNGVATGSLPVTISATGFSGVTAKMQDIVLFNNAKTVDYILRDYMNIRKFY